MSSTDSYQEWYEAHVLACIRRLQEEHPNGDWPNAFPEHEEGLCITCDAIRRLDATEL